MALDHSRPAGRTNPPLFVQLEARLRARIVDNGLKPGDKLPSESELATAFSVSRITVRHALASLAARGLIEKVNGKGSFVTQPAAAPELGPLTGISEAMRRRGLSASGQVLSTRRMGAPAKVAYALRLAPGTPIGAITSLRLVSGQPVAVGITYAKPALIDALLAEDLTRNDVMALLEGRLGYRLASTQIEAGAEAAGKQLAQRLGMETGAPVLRMLFTTYDVNDTALCFSEVRFRADRFTYRARVRR